MTPEPNPREAALYEALARRILVFDGAMGTLMQARCKEEADFRGERFKDHPKDLKGDHEIQNLSQPDVVVAAHREYLRAGADIIETNTFNANRISQADYGTEDLAGEMNVQAAREIARQLRLRDLGGVIVNDFIDMRRDKHRRGVERALPAARWRVRRITRRAWRLLGAIDG